MSLLFEFETRQIKHIQMHKLEIGHSLHFSDIEYVLVSFLFIEFQSWFAVSECYLSGSERKS